jgi:hypothetical protein
VRQIPVTRNRPPTGRPRGGVATDSIPLAAGEPTERDESDKHDNQADP